MPKQLPSLGEVFLDHTAFFVPAMDAAADVLERCGFRLTPFTVQTNREGDATVPSGTGNRCAMLRNGYLEVLAATPSPHGHAALGPTQGTDRRPSGAASRRLHQRRRDGRAQAARRGRFPDIAARRYAPAGWGRLCPFHDRPHRARHDAGRPRTVPHAPHRAAGLDPEMLDHPNGAEALTALWIAADDPAEPAARYARFTGRPAIQMAR